MYGHISLQEKASQFVRHVRSTLGHVANLSLGFTH